MKKYIYIVLLYSVFRLLDITLSNDVVSLMNFNSAFKFVLYCSVSFLILQPKFSENYYWIIRHRRNEIFKYESKFLVQTTLVETLILSTINIFINFILFTSISESLILMTINFLLLFTLLLWNKYIILLINIFTDQNKSKATVLYIIISFIILGFKDIQCYVYNYDIIAEIEQGQNLINALLINGFIIFIVYNVLLKYKNKQNFRKS